MLELPSGETQQPAGRPQTPALPGLRLNDAEGSPRARVVWVWVLVAGASSGALTALAFPPAGVGFLGFVCIAPLAVVFNRVRPRLVAAGAAAFGFAFFGMLLSWISAFGAAAYLSLISLQTAWLVAVLVAGALVRDRLAGPWSFILFPVTFVASEYLRAHLPFTGFTWGGLGYTQHDAAGVLRLASYTGVWGLSFLLALTGSLVGEGAARLAGSLKTAPVMLFAALLLGMAPAMLPVSNPKGAEAKVALIQGNHPEDLSEPGSDDLSVLLNHARLTDSVAGRNSSLVVWPEEAAGSDPLGDAELELPLIQTIRGAEVPFLVGARIEVDEAHFRNRAYFFDGNARPSGFYDKTRLVPFGEFVPWRKILTPIFSELGQVPKDGVPGSSLPVFHLPQGKFAAVICFESTFPDLAAGFVRKGARFLVVITDNSSFGRSAASRQHLMFSQLRAAENRMWVAHAAVTGISAVVAPDGGIVRQTGLFEPAILVSKVRFATKPTFYARWGDWFPAACVLLLGILLLAGIISHVRRLRRWGSKGPNL